MKNKKFLFISLLILAIGFAAVSTTLYISGNLVLGTNKSDFDIYFNKAILDDVDVYENVISEDKRTITFTTKNLKTIGDKSILEYQVMNNSRGYDAKVEVNCNLSDNRYVSYTNTLNDTILAQTVEDGVLTVTLDKVSTEEVEETITCNLVYNATERTSEAELYDENTYVLSGYLEDEEGNALANQNIVVYSETPHITSTNSLGYFYVENLLNEKHEIYITNKTKEELENMKKDDVINSSISKGTFKVTNDTINLDNSYLLKNEKIVVSSNFDKTCADLVGTIYNYDYTGEEQTFISPCDGTYKLETWGAQGGTVNSNYFGGYGSYSIGNYKLLINKVLYLNVGGTTSTPSGGYNGGGTGQYNGTIQNGYYLIGRGGGGATHIAKASGLLKNLSSDIDNIMIIAGGGGGSVIGDQNYSRGGHAGGYIGGDSTAYPFNGATLKEYFPSSGGTQTGPGDSNGTFGSFGLGANGASWSAGGGAGLYGGNSGWGLGGGGGSGYIGNPNLTNKAMYCYNCEESPEENTKTISTKCTSETPTENCAKQGNGYAKITLVSID